MVFFYCNCLYTHGGGGTAVIVETLCVRLIFYGPNCILYILLCTLHIPSLQHFQFIIILLTATCTIYASYLQQYSFYLVIPGKVITKTYYLRVQHAYIIHVMGESSRKSQIQVDDDQCDEIRHSRVDSQDNHCTLSM